MSSAPICGPTRELPDLAAAARQRLSAARPDPAARAEWQSLLLPTPMAVSQTELPIAALVYDRDGSEVARQRLGRLPRDHATALRFDETR